MQTLHFYTKQIIRLIVWSVQVENSLLQKRKDIILLGAIKVKTENIILPT